MEYLAEVLYLTLSLLIAMTLLVILLDYYSDYLTLSLLAGVWCAWCTASQMRVIDMTNNNDGYNYLTLSHLEFHKLTNDKGDYIDYLIVSLLAGVPDGVPGT